MNENYKQYIDMDLSDSPKGVLNIIYEGTDLPSISAISRNPTVSKKIQMAIARSKVISGKIGLFRNKNIDIEAAVKVFETIHLSDLIIKKLKASSELQYRIANNPNYLLRKRFAKHFKIKEEVQTTLLDDEHYSVRVALVNNRFVTQPIRQALLKDNSSSVKGAILKSAFFTQEEKKSLCFW